MGVPRNRTSDKKKRTRRSHHAKTPKLLSACDNCGTARLSHTICGACGHYKNRAVLKREGAE